MKSLVLILLPLGVMGQSFSTKKALAAIDTQYVIDDNANIVYTKIIEAEGLTKDQLFTIASDWFTYNYTDGESVIQVSDKEEGHILGKGLFKDVHNQYGMANYYYDAWHLVQIDVKDNRVRFILSLTDYKLRIIFGDADKTSLTKITSHYPFNKDGVSKNAYGKAFAKSNDKALAAIASFEKTILSGTSPQSKSKDW